MAEGLLGQIVAHKRAEIAARLGRTAIEGLRARAAPSAHSLSAALARRGARFIMEEAQNRIHSIALVHETLSQDSRQRVSFDKVAARLAAMLASGLSNPEHPISVSIEGAAGELPAEVATPLALVLSEVMQNAVEHAFPGRAGTIRVTLERQPARMRMVVNEWRRLAGDPRQGRALVFCVSVRHAHFVAEQLTAALVVKRLAHERSRGS